MSELYNIIDRIIANRRQHHRDFDDLDTFLISDLRRMVRYDDNAIKDTVDYLIATSQKCFQHRDIRIRHRSLHLTSYLFERSHMFRKYWVQKLPDLLQFGIGISSDSEEGLVNRNGSRMLRVACIERVRDWTRAYGHAYRELVLANEFIRRNAERIARVDAESISLYEHRRREREEQMRRRQKERYRIVKEKLKLENVLENADSLDALLLILTEEEDDETRVVLEQLRERHRVLVKHLMVIKDWVECVLKLTHDPLNEQQDSVLEPNELRHALRVQKRLKDLDRACMDRGIWNIVIDNQLPVDSDSSDNDFEPVSSTAVNMQPLKRRRLQTSVSSCSTSALPSQPPDQNIVNMVSGFTQRPVFQPDLQNDPLSFFNNTTIPSSHTEPPEPNPGSGLVPNSTGSVMIPDSETRSDLVARAPVVPYDADLHYWTQTSIPFATSGLNFHHRFLGDGPDDREVGGEGGERVRMRGWYASDLQQQQQQQQTESNLNVGRSEPLTVSVGESEEVDDSGGRNEAVVSVRISRGGSNDDQESVRTRLERRLNASHARTREVEQNETRKRLKDRSVNRW